MNFTNDSRGASRFTGIGAVALVHVAIIGGLASGLVRTPGKADFTPLPVPPTIEEPKTQEPIKKLEPTIVDQPTPRQVLVEPPDLTVTPDKPLEGGITTVIGDVAKNPVTPPVVAPTPSVTLPQPVATKTTAQLACPTMGKPDVPAVNWSGEVLFKVIATVTGGRVVATEIQTLRGSLDPKTRRAFQSAIDGTMRDTYRCNGDARFEQEFQFRVD